MVTAVLRPSDLPGLHHSHFLNDLKTSADMYVAGDKILSVEYRYNQLKEDSRQPQGSADQLPSLALLLIYHGVQNVFVVHLLHRHFQIGADTIMLGGDLCSEILDLANKHCRHRQCWKCGVPSSFAAMTKCRHPCHTPKFLRNQ